ncbi:TetR family transcriptional regulator [Nonomuraea sp. KC401]|uniref:TetR/AcrR family transcriptional regulator n=1 Tax=unclassified Nonomuraea TaxID=2593643 RepID=UPI0010FF3414|nr:MULTISPECIES: TetR/AcrR family transcriptional regulator [unclassified Nonomuraea]NBE94333.1 TetR family transcriptional regulator [Nonomuraea sp. K271]TLF73133.1 TetR family transcriptional regulator [Nonomuraea sp. KC401]
METTVGLRERKKAATRQAVHEAALRLVVEHGLDHVTVESIADAANISRRTFSNYFAGKEDAVLYGEEQRFRTLVRKVRAQPPALRAWQALRGATEELYQEMGEPEREWAQRTRLARQHPSLLARQLANHAALERDLSEALSERESGVPPPVMAAAFLVGLRLAAHLWSDEQESRTLIDVMNETLDHVARPFT